jgi:hypothetical protein
MLCMLRRAFIALCLLLMAWPLHAQRGSGMAAGHGFGGGSHSGLGSQRGFRGAGGPRGGISSRRFRSRAYNGSGDFFVPDYYPLDYENPYNEADGPAPESRIVPSRIPDAPPVKPLLIEIPGSRDAATAKKLPPTVFILASGERLEVQRFILTASNLSFNLDRRQRTIPLDMVDLNATTAANSERGIDLRIPVDRNEISLSF